MNAAGDSNPRVADAVFNSRIAFSENLTERCAIRDPLSTKGRSALYRDDRDGRKIAENHPSPNRDSASAKCNSREVLKKKSASTKSTHDESHFLYVPLPALCGLPACSTTSSVWASSLFADERGRPDSRSLPKTA